MFNIGNKSPLQFAASNTMQHKKFISFYKFKGVNRAILLIATLSETSQVKMRSNLPSSEHHNSSSYLFLDPVMKLIL